MCCRYITGQKGSRLPADCLLRKSVLCRMFLSEDKVPEAETDTATI